MSVQITSLFAGVLVLVFLVLSARVIVARQSARIALGDGGQEPLQRRLRAHSNFAEYVPLGLLLMAFAEMQGHAPWLIAVIGALLLAGRLVHAVAISRSPEPIPLRVAGMALTLGALGLGALVNLATALRAMA